MMIIDWLARRADLHGERAALEVPGGRVLTYAALNQRASQVARVLRGPCGVGDGDRVALLAFNDPAHFELLYGCGKAGAVLVPLNFRLAATEILAILRDCEPRALVIDPAHAALAAPVLAEFRGAVLWLDSAQQRGAPYVDAPGQPLRAGLSARPALW